MKQSTVVALRCAAMLFLFLLAFCFAPNSCHATTYYFANAGSDTNAGTSTAAPFQTIAKLNTMLLASNPGDVFLLKGLDIFRDASIFCGRQYENAVGSGKNTTTNPPICRNVRISSYGTGPYIIDSADPVCASGSWTLVAGTTYSCTLASGSAEPEKFYVDPTFTVFSLNAQGGAAVGSSMLQQPLLAVPNFVGAASACSDTANFLDAFGPSYATGGKGILRMNIMPQPVSCSSTTAPYQLTATGAVDSSDAVQGFNTNTAGGTGLVNVEKGVANFAPQVPGFGYPTYPGVWYVSGNCPTVACTIYINLRDGTNPNLHTFEATHRNIGILIEGTNNVSVSNGVVAHSEEVCFNAVPYSRYDQINMNITFSNVTAFNCAHSDASTTVIQADGTFGSQTQGGIVFSPASIANPLLSKYAQVLNSRAGTMDFPFGTLATGGAAVALYSVHEGGPLNVCAICDNVINPGGSAQAIGYTGGLVGNKPGALQANYGGAILRNNLTNFQTGISAGGVRGVMIAHNDIYEGFAQGIQMGGSSTGVDYGAAGPGDGSIAILYNRIVNIGLGAGFGNYNGIDCNTSDSAIYGLYYIGNTINNTYAAGMTFEQAVDAATQLLTPGVGCLGIHVWNNVISQNAPLFGNGICNEVNTTLDCAVSATGKAGPTAVGGRNPNWASQADSTQNNSTIFYINPSVATYSNFSLDLQNNWYVESPGVSDVGSYGRTCAIMLSTFNDTTDHCAAADPLFTNPLPFSYGGGGLSDVTPLAASPLLGAGKPGYNGGNIGYYGKALLTGFINAILGGQTQ